MRTLRSQAFLTLALLLIVSLGSAHANADSLIAWGSNWKYWDENSIPDSRWKQPQFNDLQWKAGVAGFGLDPSSRTLLQRAPDGSAPETVYLRNTFEIADAQSPGGLFLRMKGSGVIYLNGKEVYRSPVQDESSQEEISEASISTETLVTGQNTLAAEIQPSSAGEFDLELAPAAVGIVRGPYVQADTTTSMTFRWVTTSATDSRVYYSTSPSVQNLQAGNSTSTTDHTVTVTGLKTNVKYYYKVGTSASPLSGRFDFYSPPDNGHPLPTRIWVLGDSGRNPGILNKVKTGYLNSKLYRAPNFVLMLGDNAYESGADTEYQTEFFDVLGNFLDHSISFSALGDRDTAGSTNPPAGLPYFNIFKLPGNGSMDGYPSNTEKYYSFNFGTIHFVALDSMTSDRSSSGPMMTWLQNDLDDNRRPWLVAFWHHAPYSKGNFDSDVEPEMIQMRANANRILEAHGVDLVLGAHSNSYERSYLLDGLYGKSDTFTSANVIDNSNGRMNADGTGGYRKPADSTRTGAVYITLGSSGGGVKGTPLNHPGMFFSKPKPGSIAIDLDCGQMDVYFLTKKGKAKDYFSIVKQNIRPTCDMTSPSNGATFNAPADITLSADTSDPDTRVRRVKFFNGSTEIDSDFSPPFSITWNNVPAGTYTLTAVAEDELCGTRTSAPVTVTVR